MPLMDENPLMTEVRCRDETFVPAPPSEVYDVLADLRTYDHWWTLMQAVPMGDHEVRAGTRWEFRGGRPGGRSSSWTVEVLEAVRPERIEMEYVDGDLLGRVAWELRPEGDGTVVGYVYRGVRAAHPASAETFRRYGTRLHSVAMQADALAGLRRYVLGEQLDDQWRSDVQTQVAAGIDALGQSG
jgi:uncharacterized protein YndB with AHSA1/START domain